MNCVNDNFFCIFGLKRSGHHPIVHWLMQSYNRKKSIYLNERIPFTNPLDIDAHLSVTKKKIYKNIKKDKEALVLSYEDLDLKKLNSKDLIPDRSVLGENRREKNILVIRDPFNNFASRIKWAKNWNIMRTFENRKSMISNMLYLWKLYARECIGATSYIPNKIVINYNKWFLSEEYRQSISNDLNISSTDIPSKIAREGSGSSFDNFYFDNKPKEMDVINRWKYFENDFSYIALINDKELTELYGKLFNPIDGLGKYINTNE